MNEVEESQEKNSGWALKAIANLGANINKFMPHLGSSCIELPKSIKRKHVSVNCNNEDQA